MLLPPFTELPPVALNVTIVGNGSVSIDPTGGSYPVGTVVTLTATADSGWHFVDWSGDLSSSTNPTSITMDAARNITATFSEAPVPPVGICEDFESGFTLGQVVGTNSEWFDGGSGPIVTSGEGLAGSIGLGPGKFHFHLDATSL